MNEATQNKILEIVRHNYNNIAVDFNTTRKKQIWPILAELASAVRPRSRVLDVGCGNGRLLEVFSDKSIHYLGTDNSAELIESAQKNYPNYNFLVEDVLTLNRIKENNFDYIFSVAVLHHLPGKKLQVEALRQMAQKLASGGEIIISVWNLWSQAKYLKLIFGSYFKYLLTKNKLDWGDVLFFWKNTEGIKTSLRYYHAFSLSELKKISHQANLKIVKVMRDKFNYYIALKTLKL